MKSYRLAANSHVLPHISRPLIFRVDSQHGVLDAWTEEGGTYPLQDTERQALSSALSMRQRLDRTIVEIHDHVVPSVFKA
jgi:hypothetical protein